jgi:hypothetical protein
VKAPRVYGNETRCKVALARYIRGADDLLDEAVAVRKEVETERSRNPKDIVAFAIEEDVRRWFENARRGLGRYLRRPEKPMSAAQNVRLPGARR